MNPPPLLLSRMTQAVCSLLLALTGPVTLASEQHERDLSAFFTEVDASYPFFDLKGIRQDWSETKNKLTEKVKTCESDTEFLGLITEAILCLRDSHLRLSNVRAPLPTPPKYYYPGISFMPATSNRVVVMWASGDHAPKLKAGTVISQIDGQPAREWLETKAQAAWGPQNPWASSSPQRARLYTYRLPFAGERDQKHTLRYLSDGREQDVEVTCNVEARGWPHEYALPSNLKRANSVVVFAKLPSGCGYMYLRTVRTDTEPGMRQALAAHPDAAGWIIDLRGNGGGGYDNQLTQLLRELPKPVAVLIDAGCISAGETLARDFARYSGARLFGATTAGASSSKRQWTFPSGIATVTFSTRSRWRNDSKPIELNGIQPDEEVEAVPEEVSQGINSEIRRAEEYLARAIAENPELRQRTNAGRHSDQAPGPALTGRVLGADGQPIPGAKVSARSWGESNDSHFSETVSGADGAFSLPNVRPGTDYRVFVQSSNHAAAFLNTTSGAKATDVGTFRLPAALPISGRVIDTAGTPLSGTSLELIPMERPGGGPAHLLPLGLGEMQTDTQGHFEIKAAPGHYRLKVYQSVRGGDRCWQQIALNPPLGVVADRPITNLDVLIVPPDAHTISGIAIDGQGKAQPGTVADCCIPHDRHWWSRSDAEGRFVLRSLNGIGRNPLDVYFDDYKTVIRNVPIGTTNLVLVKDEPGRISGTLAQEDGATPVKEFQLKVDRVHLRDCSAITMEPGARVTLSGDPGTFRIESVPAGRVVLEFKIGPRRYWAEVEVRPGSETTDARIVLRPTCKFEGTAQFTSSDGRTQNVGLEVVDIATGRGQGWIDSERSGAFHTDVLPAGEYDVRAVYGAEVYQTKRIRLEYGKTTREDFAVGGKGMIKGRIQFHKDIAGSATIHLRESGLSSAPFVWGGRPPVSERVMAWTVAEKSAGTYRLASVPAGTWEIVAYAGATDRSIPFDRLPHAACTVTVAEGETRTLGLVLSAPDLTAAQ